jgi:hypothetical protein
MRRFGRFTSTDCSCPGLARSQNKADGRQLFFRKPLQFDLGEAPLPQQSCEHKNELGVAVVVSGIECALGFLQIGVNRPQVVEAIRVDRFLLELFQYCRALSFKGCVERAARLSSPCRSIFDPAFLDP